MVSCFVIWFCIYGLVLYKVESIHAHIHAFRTAFIVLTCAHLLKDVVNGARMIVMSTKQSHNGHTWFRFFFGGMLLATVSLFTLYASAVYNSAIATSELTK